MKFLYKSNDALAGDIATTSPSVVLLYAYSTASLRLSNSTIGIASTPRFLASFSAASLILGAVVPTSINNLTKYEDDKDFNDEEHVSLLNNNNIEDYDR